MADVGTQQLNDTALITGGSRRLITFRPLSAGPVSITSVPAEVPAHSESGNLGSVTLLIPGSPTPPTNIFKLSDKFLTLSHAATAAELAHAGVWTCEIQNLTETDTSFATTILFPTDIPVSTASLDIGLLNLILTRAFSVAAIKIHIETNSDDVPRTFVQWSDAVAHFLNGMTEQTFLVDDIAHAVVHLGSAGDVNVTFRIPGLDSSPFSPSAAFVTDPMRLQLFVNFITPAVIQSRTDLVPDIDVNSLNVTVNIGFDGTIATDVEVSAILRLDAIDLSSLIKSTIEDKVNSQLATSATFGQGNLALQIQAFFIRLMQLGVNARIQSFNTNGESLLVTYFLDTPTGAASPAAQMPGASGPLDKAR
jgi:hypothetical protein